MSDALIVIDTSDDCIKVITDLTVNKITIEQRHAMLRELIGTPEHTLAKQ